MAFFDRSDSILTTNDSVILIISTDSMVIISAIKKVIESGYYATRLG